MTPELARYLDDRRLLVDAALDGYLTPTADAPIQLIEAMRYSVFAGGKRLRPVLALAGADAVHGDRSNALPLACAVECIHTFSLIHDDLPAIDNDALRRGNPTNHVVYGEAMAILAGDALLALSFDLISECGKSVAADRVLQALSLVAKASGTIGMVGGQVSDLACEGLSGLSIETVSSIHARKTGALLSASLLGGACLAGATANEFAALRIYGDQIGLAFQITDDILDLVGDVTKIGKPIGSDLRQDKATYPKLLGVEESRTLARGAADEAVAALCNFDHQANPLRDLANYIVERDS